MNMEDSVFDGANRRYAGPEGSGFRSPKTAKNILALTSAFRSVRISVDHQIDQKEANKKDVVAGIMRV